MYILWEHLKRLYDADKALHTGIRLVPKLKYEHLNLTAFSKMRVDLAAQVSSVCSSNAKYMMY